MACGIGNSFRGRINKKSLVRLEPSLFSCPDHLEKTLINKLAANNSIPAWIMICIVRSKGEPFLPLFLQLAEIHGTCENHDDDVNVKQYIRE